MLFMPPERLTKTGNQIKFIGFELIPVKEVVLFAIIQTGGKQYRVSPGDILRVERLPGERGDEVSLKQVLLVAHDDQVRVGRLWVEGAEVKGEILRQGKAKKIIVFKKKRRKGYRRKQGHRQLYTAIQIKEIVV